MIIHHPILGPRDAQEFVYLGDASLIDRPDGMTAGIEAFHDYALQPRQPGGRASRALVSRTGRPVLAGRDPQHRDA